MKAFNQDFRLKKVFTKEDVERAIRNTKSNRMAARYLGINIKTWKVWASKYVDDNGVPLYEKHNNKGGKGMIKYVNKTYDILEDALTGKVPSWHVNANEVKSRLITNGYFPERCDRCGYSERRNLDAKVPLLLHYRDLDKRNFVLENLQLLCYNCYFISIGDVFDKAQIAAMEQFQHSQSKKMDWDLPPIFDKKYDDIVTSKNKAISNDIPIVQELPEKKEEFSIVPEKYEEKPEEQYEEDFGMDLVSFLKR